MFLNKCVPISINSKLDNLLNNVITLVWTTLTLVVSEFVFATTDTLLMKLIMELMLNYNVFAIRAVDGTSLLITHLYNVVYHAHYTMQLLKSINKLNSNNVNASLLINLFQKIHSNVEFFPTFSRMMNMDKSFVYGVLL